MKYPSRLDVRYRASKVMKLNFRRRSPLKSTRRIQIRAAAPSVGGSEARMRSPVLAKECWL
jgi:hypothetical protein